MAVITICVTGPVPTFSELFDQIVEALNIPNLELIIPEMPTFPSPPWPENRKFSYEGAVAMAEMQAQQFATTFMAMIKPFVEYLGLALEDILPQIPIIGGTLIDLLTGNVGPMLAAVKEALKDGWEQFKEFIPLPIYFNLGNLAEEALSILQGIIRQYWKMLIDVCVDLIKQITDLLELISLPDLPVLPTVEELMELVLNMLLQMVPGLGDLIKKAEFIAKATGKLIQDARDAMGAVPNLVAEFEYLKDQPLEIAKRFAVDVGTAAYDLIKEQIDALWDILKLIQIPTIEELLNAIIPDPFPYITLPDLSEIVNSIEQDFIEGFKNMISDMEKFIIDMIVDFVNDVLSMLGIEFPLICIPIVIPSFPDIPALPSIPDIPKYPEIPDMPALPIDDGTVDDSS